MSDLLTINNRLKEYYGRDELDRPNFRVVWSEGLTEKRRGEHEVWYGGIFVKREFGVVEVKKYTYLSNRHVLERLIRYTPATQPPEMVDNFSYEPIYVFQDKAGKMLPVEWYPIESYLNLMLFGTPKPKKTLKDFVEDDKAESERYEKYFEEMLDISPTAVALRGGGNSSGIIVPSNYGDK